MSEETVCRGLSNADVEGRSGAGYDAAVPYEEIEGFLGSSASYPFDAVGSREMATRKFDTRTPPRLSCAQTHSMAVDGDEYASRLRSTREPGQLRTGDFKRRGTWPPRLPAERRENQALIRTGRQPPLPQAQSIGPVGALSGAPRLAG